MHVSDVCAVSCWGVLSVCELRSLLILFFDSYLNLVTVSQQVLAFLWLRHSPSDLLRSHVFAGSCGTGTHVV